MKSILPSYEPVIHFFKSQDFSLGVLIGGITNKLIWWGMTYL